MLDGLQGRYFALQHQAYSDVHSMDAMYFFYNLAPQRLGLGEPEVVPSYDKNVSYSLNQDFPG